MNFGERNLIYRVKWIQYDDKVLPKKVVLLNKNSNKNSYLNEETFYLNKKEFNSKSPVSDILYEVFKYRVSDLYFERACNKND